MTRNLDELLKQLVNLHPKFIDLSLNRLFSLLKKIDNPHLNLPPVIHIAGTNGKGSTLSYIKNIMIENGLTVHVYISPHLKNFNERIILANNEIKTDQLIKIIKYIKQINDNHPITFFEITTAVAFYLFSKKKADFLILETGLGGRLDATNVIKDSLINIITPIGIDHQEFLGKSILKITNEKLGIIKKNSNIIISKQKENIATHIMKKIKHKKNSKLFFKKDYDIISKNRNKFTLKYKDKKISFNNPTLIGNHQIENASTAVTTILKLNELGYSFSKKIINTGLIKTTWPGRLEKGKLGNITVYLDGAHNVDGAAQLFDFFNKQNKQVWLIIGMLNNKNLFGFLKKIKPIIEGVIAVEIPNEKNSFRTEEITNICNKLKIKNHDKKTISRANKFLSNKIKPKIILITGSLYLVGKIRNKYL
jgi:dihydrofolate synthase/folylpolyglutamate synthase